MQRTAPLQTRRYLVAGARILAVAAVYFVAAKVGLLIALVRGQVTPLFPPTGIALACLLLLGMRCWPGITIGAFLVNVTIGPSFAAVVAISAGNTLAPVCACFLLARVGFRPDLLRLKDALALVFVAALGSMLISATIGTATLAMSGALQPGDFWVTWSVWWTGDAMGVLVIAPVLLVAATRRWHWDIPLVRWLEAATLILGVLVGTIVVTRLPVTLLFLIFPLLIWAALRFQQVGAAPCILIVAINVVIAAEGGYGPFHGLDLLNTMITLQAFNGAATLTALLLAAITSERNEAERSLQRAASQLSDAVRMLEPYSLLNRGLFRKAFRYRDEQGDPTTGPTTPPGPASS
ncbi:MAG: MASE1 domain-containing protein [Actinophytocola sp.]|uniref:MASE1 domain-containing protein n=1 Tax=Actinophytocola sp. TaxID=1872138 RepID=UPI003C76F3C8